MFCNCNISINYKLIDFDSHLKIQNKIFSKARMKFEITIKSFLGPLKLANT